MSNDIRTTPTPPAAPQSNAPEAALLPPVDVLEDASSITLYADLPGASKDSLSLQVDGDVLRIEAAVNLNLPQDLQPNHAEVALARYRRSFSLSKELDAEAISAELANGVLRVRIPKAAHAQPRRVSVQVG